MTGPLLITCVGVRDDLPLLPHWLRHYQGLGVEPERIVCLLNAEDENDPGLAEAEALLAAEGGVRAERWIAPYTSATMWAARRAAQARHAGPSDWVLSADVDEFHEYPEPLPAFLARCDAMGADCVQGPFVDRLGPGGALPAVAPAPALADQFPLAAEVGLALGGVGQSHNHLGTVKIMAMKGDVAPSRGGHHPVERHAARYLYGAPLGEFAQIADPAFRFAVPTVVHHYHWTASLPTRLRRRLATPGVSRAGAEYGAKQLAYLEEHGGIRLADVALRGAASGEDWLAQLDRLRRQGRWIGRIRPARTAWRRLRARLPLG